MWELVRTAASCPLSPSFESLSCLTDPALCLNVSRPCFFSPGSRRPHYSSQGLNLVVQCIRDFIAATQCGHRMGPNPGRVGMDSFPKVGAWHRILLYTLCEREWGAVPGIPRTFVILISIYVGLLRSPEKLNAYSCQHRLHILCVWASKSRTPIT